MSTDRFVNVFGTDHLTSNFVAHNFGGRVESGYRFDAPVVAVTPYGAFQAQRLYLPGYSESAPSGSAFALTYNAQNFATSRTELGAGSTELFSLLTPTPLRCSRAPPGHMIGAMTAR
jgi:uncharacterized protein with beta-barrel porin domain